MGTVLSDFTDIVEGRRAGRGRVLRRAAADRAGQASGGAGAAAGPAAGLLGVAGMSSQAAAAARAAPPHSTKDELWPRFVPAMSPDIVARLARISSQTNLQCQLCNLICRNAAKLRCGNNPVCWNCAVKKITQTHQCWDCGESSITTELHLVQDFELRGIINEFFAIYAEDKKFQDIYADKLKLKVTSDIREYEKPVNIEKRPWNSKGDINTSWLEATLDKIAELTGNKNS